MMIRDLQPPLSVIEHDLFAETKPMEACTSLTDSNAIRLADVLPSTPELPSFLQDAIKRRVEAQSAHSSEMPIAAGQIRRITHVPDSGGTLRPLIRPIALLLDHEAEVAGHWSGWLVSPEVDYATAWDVLLEADVDEPFDPSAGMVQLWNPLTCPVTATADLLVELSASRMDGIRAAAARFPHLDNAGKPRPGFIAPRTVAGHTLLTGSPLGDSHDPRRTYQSFYLEIALALNTSADVDNVVSLSRKPSPRKATWQRQPNLWLAIAATVMVVQGGVIGFLMQNEAGSGDEMSQVRSAGTAPEQIAQIEVSFRPETPESEIRRLLNEIDAEIVAGPGQLGFYQLHLKRGDVAEAVVKLKTSASVDSVEALGPKGAK